MYYPIVHIIEFFVLGSIYIYYKRKRNNLSCEKAIVYLNVQYFLFLLLLMIAILNIYFWFNSYESTKFNPIITNLEYLQNKYYKLDKRSYPYWLSQIFVILITFLFYIIVYIKQKSLYKK